MKTPNFEELEDNVETGRPLRAPRRKGSSMWFWKAFVIFLMSTIGFGAFFYLYLRYAELPPNEIANPSAVVASDGTMLTNLVKGDDTHRIKIPLADMPQNLIEATIDVEDQHFYQHSGINPAGIARALWVDLKSGQVVEGGSTITQQLAKNLFLTQDQTISRKLREAMLTIQLEMNYSKDEILEQYLNVIYYGHGAYGVEMAAKSYFNKDAQDLNLAEAALLAGLPKGPSIYDPYLDFNQAKERQRIVLDLMATEGHITPAEADRAFQEKLELAPQKMPSGKAPYFTDFVSYQLKTTYGISDGELYRGGLKIETTLDSNLQAAAEQAVQEQLKKLPATAKNMQVSLVAMDPNTGAIKAMVGGRDYKQSSFNRALAKRQPGSAFKPVVYLTALMNNYTPATRIKSEQTTFTYKNDQGEEKTYDVHNYGDHYLNNYIAFRDAIARSDNVFAVTTVMDIGPEKVINTAKALGLTGDMKPYPSLALGVFPESPLEMVKAYAPLANGGYSVEPHVVQQIEDAAYNKITAFEEQKNAILDPGVTFILTDMMKSVYTSPSGTGFRVHEMFNRPAAGKTGTTDTDAWMIGYTPDLVTAVWVGYDKDQLLSPTESYVAAPIWAQFMQAAHAGLPVRDFTPPSNVSELYIDPDSGQLATENCPTQQREYFLAGSEPTQWCEEHPSVTGTVKNIGTKTEGGLKSFWNWVTGN
ncbi:transglycosylase domain-containing protein [Tumebacillus permanentifrigoris]|uniref:Penicillin-binding protein 1B n=1 Tax=Tumebacillus permanentifrigoris TaxID=378543 RepID=A0A316DEI9_9BACL|nr:PBP1A family penicillin-binding protein [Tumebacillus permanentifrigoris]PWK16375.1 penicillin-binding protein 1B [Tumebacillus permanentifrigoris]